MMMIIIIIIMMMMMMMMNRMNYNANDVLIDNTCVYGDVVYRSIFATPTAIVHDLRWIAQGLHNRRRLYGDPVWAIWRVS